MHQRKILLLENVATQTAGLREQLTQAGFQVAVSRYEADGLKRLVEWSPDLVLVSTAHPAGDFVEYCRRVRALAPAVRIVVTSPLTRDRLFQEFPGLQPIVDGVLLRPYTQEEVAAMLATTPLPPRAPAAAPADDPGNAELRAEFQRQLDARFLEVEELKRHLEVATRRAASIPGLEWLQSENEHLRQGVEEVRKKSALALAAEQLKRSEIEVQLESLLRMKEDFEFRAQNEIEDRKREIELVSGQFEELRERSDKAAEEHAVLRAEMERALVEKEQIEERLHALESGGSEAAAPADAPPEDAARSAALEAELSRQRALAAEGQIALAELAVKAAASEESLASESAAREEKEQLLADAHLRVAELQASRDGMHDRLTAAENTAAAAQTAFVAASARRAELEKELADVQEARSEDARLAQKSQSAAAARAQELLERAASAERRSEQLQSACSELEKRLGASEAARISAAETAALVAQREAEVAGLRARAEELGREVESLRALKAESEKAGRDAELLGRELAESRDRARGLAAECERAAGMHQERERVLAGDVESWRGKAEAAALEIRQLQSQVAERASREEVDPEAGAGPMREELGRIQGLLEEVLSRARNEAVDYARRDAELSVRLQAALDERRLLQERFDRASAEASERERRSSSLLQSAIDHGPLLSAERANLPAVVPLDPGPGRSRLWPVLAGLAVVLLAVFLAVYGLRRPPAAVRETRPALPRPQPGAAPGATLTPREVWDRWTRSDGSGGVLVQATLRSEQELRAEVEAERTSGRSAEELRAELGRRLDAFRFDTTHYVTVYIKNLAPGYPAYLDDLPGRFRLRDSKGKEVPAFLPPGHEKDNRIFSFGAGAPGDLVYEASVSLGFDRAGLSPSPDYLQLVVSDMGAASRRVLTWELE